MQGESSDTIWRASHAGEKGDVILGDGDFFKASPKDGELKKGGTKGKKEKGEKIKEEEKAGVLELKLSEAMLCTGEKL